MHSAMRQAGIPFGFFEFPVAIVRYKEGGVCSTLHPQKLTCRLLGGAGLNFDGRACSAAMYRWYRNACAEMFPPLEMLPWTPTPMLTLAGEPQTLERPERYYYFQHFLQ